jgi:hypothetical protein
MQTKKIIALHVAGKNPAYTMAYFAQERNEAGVIITFKSECLLTSEVERLQIVVGDLMAV